MRIELEYGEGTMAAELPDSSDVFIPGDTVPDPPHIAKDQVEVRTREAILYPIGMPPIADLVGPNAKVCIVFSDRVKGGFQSDSHRRVACRVVLEELDFRTGQSGVGITATGSLGCNAEVACFPLIP